MGVISTAFIRGSSSEKSELLHPKKWFFSINFHIIITKLFESWKCENYFPRLMVIEHHKNLSPHCTLMPNYFQLSFFIRTTFLVNFYSKLFPNPPFATFYSLNHSRLSSQCMREQQEWKNSEKKGEGKTLSTKKKFIEESGEWFM